MPAARKNDKQPEAAEPDGPCLICFPGGLPGGAHSGGCEHGTWYAEHDDSGEDAETKTE